MSEEIDIVGGATNDKDEVVLIVVSGKLKKGDGKKLLEDLKQICAQYKLSVKLKKSS